jgi:putative ABC transport system permease protein
VKLSRAWLKLLRDVRRSRWQFIAAGVVIALGVAIFIGAYSSYQNLRTSYDRTYDELQMADLWFDVPSAQASSVETVRDQDGVAAAEGRLIQDLPAVLPEKGVGRVLIRFITLPGLDGASRPTVNDIKVTDGSYVSSGTEVLLERSFFDFNDVNVGDPLQLILPDGRTVDLTIAGAAASPEYLWVARSEQELFTVPSEFGVAFIDHTTFAGLVGSEGSVNSVAVRLAPGADAAAVETSVSDVIAPGGQVKVTDLDHQVSNRLLQLDLDGFRSLALVFPVLFLTISTLAIYSLLNRLVQNQRGQIGVMRAMGYEQRQIIRHYFGYGLVIGVAGATLGAIVGIGLAALLTFAYAHFLQVPFVSIRMNPGVIAIAFAAGLVASLVAAVVPAWASARVRPADAMRPPAPPAGHRTLIEVVLPPLKRAPSVIKLPLRSIFRSPRRALYTGFGVAAGVALTLVAASLLDSYNSAVDLQFDKIQRYDARLNSTSAFPPDATEQAAALDGVTEVEPLAEVPVLISSSDGSDHATLARGLQPDGDLMRAYTPGGKRVRTGDGILLTGPVSDDLGVGIGDEVTVRPLVGGAEPLQLPVDDIVRQPLGDVSFVGLDTAQTLLGAPGVATALLVNFRTAEPSADLEAGLLSIPSASNIELTSDLRDYVGELNQLFIVFVVIMLGFAVALGFTIIFNTITINVLERERELATMRTFGTGITRLASMLTVENVLMGLLGVALGMPIGYGLALYFATLYQNDIFDMPMVINGSTYAIAGVAAIIVLLLAEVPAIRYVRKLDLPSVVRELAT